MAQRGKGKSMAFPSGGDFIALGSKSGGSGGAKRDAGSSSAPSAMLPKKPKLASSAPTSGRPHISAGPSVPLPGAQGASMPSVDKSQVWETLAIEVDPAELLDALHAAEEAEDKDRIDALLSGVVKQLRRDRIKPEQKLYLPLMYLSKCREHYFVESTIVIEAFCSLLRRDLKDPMRLKAATTSTTNVGGNGGGLVSVIVANILLSAFRNEKTWPELFVRVYIEDALGERLWVDHPDCKPFVDNILTAFKTKQTQINSANIFYQGTTATGGKPASGVLSNTPETRDTCPSPPVGVGSSRSESGSATPTRLGQDDDSLDPTNLPINAGDPNVSLASLSPSESVPVVPRYHGLEESIQRHVVELVQEQLNRRQGPDNINRNLIKFLASAAGLVEIRQIVITRLEMWIMNQKIMRFAQDLLLAVVVNCTTHTPADVEVIANFAKLRLKTKPSINLYLAAIRELCAANKENLPTLLKHTIFNELSNSRNHNNMAMLQVMFSCDTSLAPSSLAAVFLELLMQKECYLRALRVLLREIVRSLRYDINLALFCSGLMVEPRANVFKDFEFKDRMFTSIIDLIVLSIFLGISPPVRESMTSYLRNDKKDPIHFKNFLRQTALIQQDAIAWIRESGFKLYKPDPTTCFLPGLHKLLFIANSEEYCRIDGWPLENERGLYFKATSEIPLLQGTILSILVIGLSKSHPLNGRDAVDLVDVLVKRASGLYPISGEEFPVLAADKVTQILECLFQATAYNYPDSIALPHDYTPPSMAIANAYWKAWIILVLLCAHNSSEFGALAWESYPTLRACMEMCITNQFTFPPPTIASGEQADEMKAKELQLTSLEKTAILDFEMHLAAATNHATITESNSLLLAQLITMDPKGGLRRPPQSFLDQLQQANQHYKIGHLLCRSRNPDFLLDILQRQGTNQAMPWLADLVESSEGSFNVLPVQCLCEFLLNSSLVNREDMEDIAETEVMSQKLLKQRQLLHHLQDLLQNPKSDFRASTETLEYFLRRLSSQQTRQRLQALRGLRLVLTPLTPIPDDGMIEIPDKNNEWLLRGVPMLPHFIGFYPQIAAALREACQCENDPSVTSLYIQFLANYLPPSISDYSDLCLDIGSIIVERSTILPAMLPGTLCKTDPATADATFNSLLGLFQHYMFRIRQPRQIHNWSSDGQEIFNIVWNSEGLCATVHYCTVLAQIILLTYGPPAESSRSFRTFMELFRIWYPPPGQEQPRAFAPDSTEELDLIPDWLKLRMIRTEAGLLVDAALCDLEPNKLVLFIQSFGIPVASMSKLLQKLDRIVQTDFESVNEAVMDKAYMAKLVSVQHERGATGGHIFAEALGLNLKSTRLKPDMDDMNNMVIRRVPPVVPPRSTAMIPPAAVKSTLLHLFDVGSPSRMTQKEKQDTLRTLQKYLTNEIRSNAPTTPMVDATVKAFDTIIKSELKESFTAALFQRTAFSCGIFALICNALLRRPKSNSTTSLLRKVGSSIISSQQKKSTSSTALSPLKSLLDNFCRRVDEMSTNKPSTEAEKKKTYEDILRKQVVEAINTKTTNALIESMAKLLLSGNDVSVASPSKKSKTSAGNAVNAAVLAAAATGNEKENKMGLLIDWLQMLDPELLQSSSDTRLRLLFSHIKEGTGSENGLSRPHLLTMVTHQASWSTLRVIIDRVLSSRKSEFDASAVLDFVATCIDLQKQWQSRDKHVPKHDNGLQDVLSLTDDQFLVLVDYGVEESLKLSPEVAIARRHIQNRIPLFVSCMPSRSRSIRLADFLRRQIEATKDESLSSSDKRSSKRKSVPEVKKSSTALTRRDVAREFLLQVYMKIPHCLLHISPDDRARLLPDSIPSESNSSVADCFTHSLLSALAGTQQGRDWCKQMLDFETAARKVAATHPVLVLRNLPLISASLKGRTQYDFSFFRTRNHMTLFNISIGILELLTPFVFRPEYTSALQEALLPYFEMLSAYTERRESMCGLVDKFISFLHKYVEAQPSQAVRFIRRYGTMLPEYSRAKELPPAIMSNIKSLVSLTRVTEVPPTQAENLSSSVVACFGLQSFSRSEAEALQAEAQKIISALQTSGFGLTEAEVFNTLEAVKKAGVVRPGILLHCMDEILNNLSHNNKRIRSLALDLVQLLLKQSPNQADQVVPTLMACIQSSDQFVALSTIEKLPDICPLLTDHLPTLLTSSFAVGLYAYADVTSHLADTIATLNSQKGF